MRILQISSAHSIGGGETHLAGVSNELTKRGHEVFAALRPNAAIARELSALPTSNLITLPLRNALDVKSAVNIARFVADKNIELINVHLARDYPIAALAAAMNRIPFVITRHVLFPMKRIHRVFLSSVKYVIAPSNAVAENLRREGIFPPGKIVTIRYGLDVDKFARQARVTHPNVCVGSVGNLDPVKGFDVLIRAAEIVSKQRPDVKFKIVGEDRSRDGRNENELRNLVARLRLGSVVEFAGWSDNVRGMLSGFDVFVSASRSESFGFVIAEAMLAGVPVIATETDGATEIISDPSLGRLVQIGSHEAIANAILELVLDSEKRGQLVQRGRDHIEAAFSLKRTVDETEDLYQRAIATG
ncbi:MAG TPA: glycosyltransferase family 4 protein [Pyrinomonadaceae bacterium]|nr:glycosyltransferase family 4 protein [Pyrinomonadaceae bacterium]